MGKCLSTAILAVAAFAFVSCYDDDKKKTDNIAKGIAKEYTIATGSVLQKLQLVEVSPTAVKFALDSVQVDSVTAISIKAIEPVQLTRQQDTIVLSADLTLEATVFTVQAEEPETPASKATASSEEAIKKEEKSVKVVVKGKVVAKKLDLQLTFPALLAEPATLEITGMSK
jgi:hypothetical protein